MSVAHNPESVLRFEIMQIVGPSLLGFIWLTSIVYMFTQNRSREA